MLLSHDGWSGLGLGLGLLRVRGPFAWIQEESNPIQSNMIQSIDIQWSLSPTTVVPTNTYL